MRVRSGSPATISSGDAFRLSQADGSAEPPQAAEGGLERGRLQLDPEADRGRLGEHELRIGAVGEARERLVADDLISRELDYRLEDRMELSGGDDARDVVAATPQPRSARPRPVP